MGICFTAINLNLVASNVKDIKMGNVVYWLKLVREGFKKRL
jgi:hypothetical protein